MYFHIFILHFFPLYLGESTRMNAPIAYSYEELDDDKKRVWMYFYLTTPDPPQPIVNTVSLGSCPAGVQFYVR